MSAISSILIKVGSLRGVQEIFKGTAIGTAGLGTGAALTSVGFTTAGATVSSVGATALGSATATISVIPIFGEGLASGIAALGAGAAIAGPVLLPAAAVGVAGYASFKLFEWLLE